MPRTQNMNPYEHGYISKTTYVYHKSNKHCI